MTGKESFSKFSNPGMTKKTPSFFKSSNYQIVTVIGEVKLISGYLEIHLNLFSRGEESQNSKKNRFETELNLRRRMGKREKGGWNQLQKGKKGKIVKR